MKTEICLESMENHLSVSGMFSPGHATVEILEEIHIKMANGGTNPEEFEDRFIFMSMFQRHRLDKEMEILLTVFRIPKK